MLLHSFLLTAVGVIAIYGQDVTKLSVKTGGIISVPCSYDSQYAKNVKYLCLCKRNVFERCQKLVETDQSSGPGKYSIVDDKLQNIFTVTIRDLTASDTCFLCGVSRRLLWDLTTELSLDVTNGVPNLYVALQNITAVIGGSVTIMCHCKDQNGFQWCRFGSSRCISEKYGQINGISVTVNTSLPNVTNVTMSGLKTDSGGWYFCENRKFQMPVYITITKDITTASPTRTSYVTSKTQHAFNCIDLYGGLSL